MSLITSHSPLKQSEEGGTEAHTHTLVHKHTWNKTFMQNQKYTLMRLATLLLVHDN